MDPALALAGNLGNAGEKVGVVAAAFAAAAVLILGRSQLRVAASTCALLIVPTVLIGHIWHSDQFRSISGNGLLFAGLIVYGVVLVCALAALFVRRPQLFPLLAVLALPFRVPIEAGGSRCARSLPDLISSARI